MEADKKVDLSQRRGHNARKREQASRRKHKRALQWNFSDKAQSELSNSRRKLSTGQMFESRRQWNETDLSGNLLATNLQNFIDLALNWDLFSQKLFRIKEYIAKVTNRWHCRA